MELHIIKIDTQIIVILLDNKMKIVLPVYEYLKKLRLDGKSERTILAYGRDLKLYWEFLVHNLYSYSEVSPSQIQEFKEFLHKQNPFDDSPILYQESKRSAKTINRILNTVYGFYKYHSLTGEISNPILTEKIPQGFNTFKRMLEHARLNNTNVKSIFKVKVIEKEFTILNEEQIEKVYFLLTNNRDRLIWRILETTGARIQEILSLTFENIPIPDSTEPISILKNVKSKGKYRDILIPTDILIELDNYIMEERYNFDLDHDYIFVTLSRKNFGNELKYSPIYQKFKSLEEKAGFKFNFHDLRHTFITNLIEDGFDISVIKEIVGHNHISTTQKYARISKRYQKEVLSSYWAKKIIGEKK